MSATATSEPLVRLLDRVADSYPLSGHDGRSGARIERAVLDDGTPIVVKRVRYQEDLCMLLTADHDGREARLWSAGVLDRLPAGLSHAVLAAGRRDDELVTCMRDLTGSVFTWRSRVDTADLRRIFAALTRMHGDFAGRPLEGLCPLTARVALFEPNGMARLADGSHRLPPAVVRGWELFGELAPPDVVSAVFAALADPQRVVRGLRGAPPTLLHGDFTSVNVALHGGETVLLDWALATEGPAVLDFVCFMVTCASQTELDLPALLDEVRIACGPWHDENVLRAALFWGVLELGWNKALDAAVPPRAAPRADALAELTWWTARAREALDAGVVG